MPTHSKTNLIGVASLLLASLLILGSVFIVEQGATERQTIVSYTEVAKTAMTLRALAGAQPELPAAPQDKKL